MFEAFWRQLYSNFSLYLVYILLESLLNVPYFHFVGLELKWFLCVTSRNCLASRSPEIVLLPDFVLLLGLLKFLPMHVQISIQTKTERDPFSYSCNSFSPYLYSLGYSVPPFVATLSFLKSSLCLLNSEGPLDFDFLSPAIESEHCL